VTVSICYEKILHEFYKKRWLGGYVMVLRSAELAMGKGMYKEYLTGKKVYWI
jgi:hypothetical protein